MTLKKVFVGLSGGVDSSVAALLLKQQGYEVTGVYMKNWSRNIGSLRCTWQQDYQDAKRISVQLGIGFKLYDFQKQYKQKVVDYMVKVYKAGRTPNPDIVCNQEVKFKLFLQTAIEDGADYIATGHYARLMPSAASPASGIAGTLRSSRRAASSERPALTHRTDKYGSLRASAHPSSSTEPKTSGKNIGLYMSKDKNKDQTYFLYRMSKEALMKTLFPIGYLTKSEVREIAKKYNLISADRKESMGICFVGEVGIKDFLSEYIDSRQGDIRDQKGHIVGSHDGAEFYTIGQRHGLNVGGGLPFYVVGKNMAKNEIHVTTDLQDENLWSKHLSLTGMHWIDGKPADRAKIQVRTRHRAELIRSNKLNMLSNMRTQIELEEEVRALTPGQSAVLYSGEKVLGGGVVI